MSELKSKVVVINNRRTSVRLCNSEWLALEDLCKRERVPRNRLIEAIENSNHNNNQKIGLTGAIRLFSIIYYHTLSNEFPYKANVASKNEYLNQIFKNLKQIKLRGCAKQPLIKCLLIMSLKETHIIKDFLKRIPLFNRYHCANPIN